MEEHFKISVRSEGLFFVKLDSVHLMEPHSSLTLFWQMIGYWCVMFEALSKCPADVVIDTLGVAFAYPLVKLVFGIKMVSYTHYPTISTDMLAQTTKVQFNNRHTGLSAYFKRFYYRVLLRLYAVAGRSADRHMANGSWTYNHLCELWEQRV